MARTSSRSRFVTRSGDGAIHVVIKESGDVLYLEPKPGGERVRQGCTLLVVVSNLTSVRRQVMVTFSSGMNAARTKVFPLDVATDSATSRAILLRNNFFARDRTADVLLVGYRVTVGGTEIDPDLEIER